MSRPRVRKMGRENEIMQEKKTKSAGVEGGKLNDLEDTVAWAYYNAHATVLQLCTLTLQKCTSYIIGNKRRQTGMCQVYVKSIISHYKKTTTKSVCLFLAERTWTLTVPTLHHSTSQEDFSYNAFEFIYTRFQFYSDSIGMKLKVLLS